MTEFVEKFLACERQHGLFRREIGGVRYWHLIRYRVFNDIVLPQYIPMGPKHPDDELSGAPRLGSRARLAKFLFRNPATCFKKYPILFAMTPRMAAMEAGQVGYPTLDFVASELNTPYALLESPRLDGYTVQPSGRKVFHWPFRKRVRDVRLSPDGPFASSALIRKVEAEALAEIFATEYGFKVESGRIWWMIDDLLRFREIYGDAMHRWLKRLGVRVLVTSVAEYREHILLTEAAHDLGICVVELQHGTVYPEHVVYNLGDSDPKHSPDYFFSWGGHWNRQLRNYPALHAVACGNPFLDHFVATCPRTPDVGRLRVLFVSQGPIGEELSRLAVVVRDRFDPAKVEIAYKLHPNETKSWRALYPELAASGIRVIGNDEMNIYQCLQHADVTVGTNSTAMIEGFAWGVKALVMKNLPAGFTMEAYCRSGAAEFIEDGEHLVRRIGELADRSDGVTGFAFDSADYFRPGAVKRIARYLEDLASGKEICE